LIYLIVVFVPNLSIHSRQLEWLMIAVGHVISGLQVGLIMSSDYRNKNKQSNLIVFIFEV